MRLPVIPGFLLVCGYRRLCRGGEGVFSGLRLRTRGEVRRQVGPYGDASTQVEVPKRHWAKGCGEGVVEIRVSEPDGEVGWECKVTGDEEMQFKRKSEESW